MSIIQKDVPAETVDAMKRTISSMLGLLPSDQFHVVVEALWDPLFKLLVSSMKTGYDIRIWFLANLQKSLQIYFLKIIFNFIGKNQLDIYLEVVFDTMSLHISKRIFCDKMTKINLSRRDWSFMILNSIRELSYDAFKDLFDHILV